MKDGGSDAELPTVPVSTTRPFEQLVVENEKPQARRSIVRRCLLLAVAMALIVALGLVATLQRDAELFDDDYLPGGWSVDEDDDDQNTPINRLKAELHALTAEQARQRFGEITARGPAPPRQSKIDNFVVLYMENHASDHFFGCMDLPGYDGIRGHRIPKPDGTFVEVTCGHSDYVCKSGPSYDTFQGKFDPVHGQPHLYPYSPQSDDFSASHGVSATGQTAVAMFGPEQVPVKKAIAENFGVFNKMYTAVPSASSPNHLFTQSATSCGMQHNGLYNDCAPSARASRPRPLRRPLPPLDGLWLSHTRSELCGQPLSRRSRPSALKPVSTRGCAAQASAQM